MRVYAGHICGAKHHSEEFASTGLGKGNYAVYICDKRPGHRGMHDDSTVHKSWN